MGWNLLMFDGLRAAPKPRKASMSSHFSSLELARRRSIETGPRSGILYWHSSVSSLWAFPGMFINHVCSLKGWYPCSSWLSYLTSYNLLVITLTLPSCSSFFLLNLYASCTWYLLCYLQTFPIRHRHGIFLAKPTNFWQCLEFWAWNKPRARWALK